MVDLGQVGDVKVLSADAHPTGIELAPQEKAVVLEREGGVWLTWPSDDLPRGAAPESLVAIFSDAPLDLRAIESSGVAARGDAPEGSTRPGSLQRVVDLAASGTSRSAGRRPGTVAEPIRYRVERFEFLLDPGFQIDESQALADGRASRGSPVEVAVRLLDLVILRNRAVFSNRRTARRRIHFGRCWRHDPALVARTWTFPRIADGDRLSARTNSPCMSDRFRASSRWPSG